MSAVPPTTPRCWQRTVMISVIFFVLLVISGPITGPQAIFGAVAKRGVFRDKCNSNVTAAGGTCQEQEQAIESAMDLCLSICNFVCVFWGFAQDWLGARKVAIAGVAVWTVAKACAGFAPASGIVWTAMETIAASASLGAYSSLGLEHLRHACEGNDGLYNVMGFMSSATWDIAVLLNVGLALLYGWETVTLWQAYMMYAGAAGLPVLVALSLWPARRTASVAVPHDDNAAVRDREDRPQEDSENPPLLHDGDRDDNANDGDDQSDAGSAAPATADPDKLHGSVRADMVQLLTSVDFWVFTAHCSAVVSVGYFMISNVGSLAEGHGLTSSDEKQHIRDVTTYMMSAMGVTSVLPGALLHWLGTHRGIVVVVGIECALVLAFALLMVFGELATLYTAYGIMFAWRVWGFGISFPFIAWRFAHLPRAVGVCYGGAFSLSGLVSIGVGAVSSSVLHKNPKGAVRPLMLVLCGVALLIEILFFVLAARASPRGPSSASSAHDDKNDQPIVTASDMSLATIPSAGHHDDHYAAESTTPPP